ncbi:GTP cyclohydrolase II [Neisseria sp. Ec49-e6-T10]|uniref:GTP cyclohydrolase II n=1 Tax=Neisseria sp. Ec49-e6-T10 TaxID=3140744 RepID=UPI003EBBC25B
MHTFTKNYNQPVQVKWVATCQLPTEYGVFLLHGFEEVLTGQEHVALSMGQIDNGQPVLTRLHSECLTGDALFSKRCDCGPQLEAALKAVAQEKRGLVLYLRQEGRGIGLINKIRAYQLQDQGLDTVEANIQLGLPVDARNFNIAHDMLKHLNVQTLDLMTNNPQKIQAFKEMGFNIDKRVSLEVGRSQENQFYLATKAEKLGHLLHIEQK